MACLNQRITRATGHSLICSIRIRTCASACTRAARSWKWFEANHPEYLDRLSAYVQSGRVEIIGGAFYEPILGMLSPRDRVGQVRTFREYLETRLGATVRGMWIPERVWEQSMTSDLVAARC